MAIIEVSHLTKEYRPGAIQGLKQTLLNTAARLAGKKVPERPLFKALDDVSFSIEQSEVAGNRAGKSTLFKLQTTISKPIPGGVTARVRAAPLIEAGAGLAPGRSRYAQYFVVAAFCLVAGMACAQSPAPVTVTVSDDTPGATISSRFLGLSFETSMLLPDKDGKYYFSPENKTLIAMFQTLGIKSLRIGGNSADSPQISVPGPADIDSLFSFAKAADVKVIYTLRLHLGTPDNAAAIAKYIDTRYRPYLDCFAIGNEPDAYFSKYSDFRNEWWMYFEAITASANVPDAEFCGPSATGGRRTWARDFAIHFGKSAHIAFITQHEYPGGTGRVKDVVNARDQMLSPAWRNKYRQLYDVFMPTARFGGLPCRLEEANNFSDGGAKGVSDTFAAALWGTRLLVLVGSTRGGRHQFPYR